MDAADAPAPRSLPGALLAAVRPAQWVKNGVILVPPVFALRATDARTMLRALLAVAAFCLLSGATYLGNDIADREKDRAHPQKRYRAIASGALPVPVAAAATAALAGLGLAGAALLGWPFVTVALGYLALQLAYSSALKHVAVLDVFAIAGGFVLRVVAGAEAVDVPISNWLYLTTLFLALFLALEKRRAELTLLGTEAGRHRGILSEYSKDLLDQLVAIAGSGAVITYSLYTLAPDTIHKFGSDRLKLTIPFVLLGVFRYLYLVHRRDAGGQPEKVLVHDRGMQLTLLGYVATVAWAIYTRKP
ncbi:MAG TPA: decaprenyl-phosphate phosphoribosyltransferase [Anaeromyxobacteraceae bacterium]|nr:decaprenyl-phosphate phosphoribosyltransferase [Anaeromyxobacteraceae bacterium]